MPFSAGLPRCQDSGFAACCVVVNQIYSGCALSGGPDVKRSLKMSFWSSGVLERSKSPKPGKQQRQHLVQGSERSGLGEEASRAQRRFHGIGQTHGPVVTEGSSTQLCPKSLMS